MARIVTRPQELRFNFTAALTQLALRLGLKREPCEACGVAPHSPKGKQRVHAHHDSYFRPLEIRWLCARCHRNWHVANGQAEGRYEPISLEERDLWRDELRRRYTRAA